MKFLFILALQLGMTVAELSNRVTSAELAFWFALYRQDPWGEQRGDLRNALVASLIFNSHSRTPKKLHDFMLFTQKQEQGGDDAATIRKNFNRLIERQKR